MLGPVLVEMEKEHPEYKICEVNVDSDSDLAQDYGVVSIPHLVVIKDGDEKKKTVGYHTKQELLELMK